MIRKWSVAYNEGIFVSQDRKNCQFMSFVNVSF